MAAKKAASEGAWAWVFTPRTRGERRYWLVKSEPDVFSFDDLLKAPKKTSAWDGVRNFTARNFLRDGMKKGDLVYFYHSSTNPQAIVGVCEVVKEAYPDATAFDPKHHGFDEKSSPATPTWYVVDVRAVDRLQHPRDAVTNQGDQVARRHGPGTDRPALGDAGHPGGVGDHSGLVAFRGREGAFMKSP
ncbi:MAG: EVE domain-containing protein [Gemmatimonadaceae bacterium]